MVLREFVGISSDCSQNFVAHSTFGWLLSDDQMLFAALGIHVYRWFTSTSIVLRKLHPVCQKERTVQNKTKSIKALDKAATLIN